MSKDPSEKASKDEGPEDGELSPVPRQRATWPVIWLGVCLLGIGLALHGSLPYAWGDARLWAKLEHLEIHAKGYDTVFIGSSYTYRHISPRVYDAESARLRQEAGLPARIGKSFNLAVDGMHQPATGQLFEHLISMQLPNLETVVIELGRFTSAVDPEIDRTPEAQCWRTPALTRSMIRFLWARPDKGRAQKLLQTAKLIGVQVQASLNVGHGLRILEFLRGYPDLDAGFLGPDGDGFYAVDRQAEALTGRPLDNEFLRRADGAQVLERIRTASLEAFEASTGEANPEGVRILQSLLKQADAADLELYFLVPPRLGHRYLHLRPLFAHLPADRLILEPADPRLNPQLYDLADTADRGHLNEAGALKYSRLIAGLMFGR